MGDIRRGEEGEEVVMGDIRWGKWWLWGIEDGRR